MPEFETLAHPIRIGLVADTHRRNPKRGLPQALLDGLDGCESTCAFWDFCRGAHAGNRWFEHGSFAATETAHCRNTRQALVNAFAATTAVIQPKEK